MKMDELRELLLTPERVKRIEEIASLRLSTLTLVYDHMYDLHNVSACLRSADVFGVPEIHLVTSGRFKYNRGIDKSAGRWVKVHQYADYSALLAALKEKGFTLAATVPAQDARPFQDISLPKKLALVMGSEGSGVHPDLIQQCDLKITIPMQGFSESLNLSNATTILTHHFSSLYRKQGESSLLSPSDRHALVQEWILRELNDKTRGRVQPEFFETEAL